MFAPGLIPTAFTINVVIDLTQAEAVLTRVLQSLLASPAAEYAAEQEPVSESVSLPALTQASGAAVPANPVAERPGTTRKDTAPAAEKRTRRNKAQMAADKAAAAALGISERDYLKQQAKEGNQKTDAATGAAPAPTPTATVAASAPTPAVAQPAPVPTQQAQPSTPPAQAESFDFNATVQQPAAPTGAERPATADEVEAFKKYVLQIFLPHKNGGNDKYVTVRGSVGSPDLKTGVTNTVLAAWRTAMEVALLS